jgi:hypothetical protein
VPTPRATVGFSRIGGIPYVGPVQASAILVEPGADARRRWALDARCGSPNAWRSVRVRRLVRQALGWVPR